MYEYRSKVVRIIDGDTVVMDVDLGFDVWRTETFRLNGIDTPELHSSDVAERDAAKRAKAAVASILGHALDWRVQTDKDTREKFGRYLAWIVIPDELRDSLNTRSRTVNDWLIETGHAKPYGGGKRG